MHREDGLPSLVSTRSQLGSIVNMKKSELEPKQIFSDVDYQSDTF